MPQAVEGPRPHVLSPERLQSYRPVTLTLAQTVTRGPGRTKLHPDVTQEVCRG